MPTINPYLTFLGNCEEAFKLYKKVFKKEFAHIGYFRDMPQDEANQMPKEQLDRVMHVSLPISEETVLMGSDTGGEWADNTVIGNNITISITAETKEEADRIFTELSDGGKVTMPMEKTFWGDYFGMCTDKFQINWMVSWNENAG
ncbi:VOC family protein [Halocola ammonii]